MRSLLILVALASASGCLHVSSAVPGVLDLRSDGADAPVVADVKPKEETTREGLLWFFAGAGVEGDTDVRIEDRNTFFVLWGPVFNGSSTEEWQAALNGGALRNVVLGDEYGFGNMANFVVRAYACYPLTFWVTPNLDFHAEGKRIAVDGAPALRAEPSPPPAPPDPSTLPPSPLAAPAPAAPVTP